MNKLKFYCILFALLLLNACAEKQHEPAATPAAIPEAQQAPAADAPQKKPDENDDMERLD